MTDQTLQAEANNHQNSNNSSASSNSTVDRKVQSSSSRYSQPNQETEAVEVTGVLDIMSEGHGFLRPQYKPSNSDVYISASQIRRFYLRAGDLVSGLARQPKDNERYRESV